MPLQPPELLRLLGGPEALESGSDSLKLCLISVRENFRSLEMGLPELQ